MSKATILAVLLVWSLPAYAKLDTKYNPYSGRWEVVPKNLDVDLKYNPYENNWTYQPEDSELRFNPYDGDWDWTSGLGNE